MVGTKRRSGRGDVDDDVGGEPDAGAPFGGTEAFDDPVDLDTVLGGKELLGQPPVFGRDPEPPAVTLAEIGGDVVEIGHRGDIEPDIGNSDDDIGAAEIQARRRSSTLCIGIGDRFHGSRSSPVTPISIAYRRQALQAISACRHEQHLDIVAPLDMGAILAVVARQEDRETGLLEHARSPAPSDGLSTAAPA